MSEPPAFMSDPPAPAPPGVDVTPLARPLGVRLPVHFAPALWAFCAEGLAAPGGGEPAAAADPERVARYLLTGLVRALRRAPPPAPARVPYTMALGRRELVLLARVGPAGIQVQLQGPHEGGGAIAEAPRQAG